MKTRRRRGLTSLDSLIIFIALTITTAVAGIFLLTTSSSLTQKEISHSTEARKNVAAGVEVISIIGRDPSPTGTPHRITDIQMMTRLLPGTLTLPLNTTLIHVEIDNTEQLLSYNDTCDLECLASTTQKYMVYYRKRASLYERGYINVGDVINIIVKLDRGLFEDEDMRISIIPNNGPKTMIVIQSSQNMVAQRVTLWPVA
ncbi:MAG: hypothetical protein V1875_08730 [Candidatus Altiarchaeota archaeon]